MKPHLAAHGGHAERVAISANAFDHAVDQLPGLGMGRFAKAERIHCRDWPRAHCEYVAQDAAHTGGRALVGFDIGGVVVALHFEHHGLPVANIDDPGIFTGATDDLRAFGGQGAQPFLGGLVGTMFVPHGREDAQFGKGRFPPDDLQNAFVLVGLQPVAFDQVLSDSGVLHVEEGLCGFWRVRLLGQAGQGGKG